MAASLARTGSSALTASFGGGGSMQLVDESDMGGKTRVVKVATETMEHMRSESRVFYCHRKEVVKLANAYKEVAKYERQYGEAMRAYDRLAHIPAVKDAVDGLKDAAEVHIGLGQHYDEMASRLLDLDAGLRNSIAEEPKFLQTFEKGFKTENASLQKQLKAMENMAKKGGKMAAKTGDKNAVNLQESLRQVTAQTKRISDFHKEECEKLLLEQRSRMCRVLQQERSVLGWWVEGGNACEIKRECEKHEPKWETVIGTACLLPDDLAELVNTKERVQVHLPVRMDPTIDHKEPPEPAHPVSNIDEHDEWASPQPTRSERSAAMTPSSSTSLPSSNGHDPYDTLHKPYTHPHALPTIPLPHPYNSSDSSLSQTYNHTTPIVPLPVHAYEHIYPVSPSPELHRAPSPIPPKVAPAAETSSPEPAIQHAAQGLPAYLVAAYPYTATDQDELTFHMGDRMRVIEQGDCEGWMVVEFGGRKGLVPKNYCYPEWTP